MPIRAVAATVLAACALTACGTATVGVGSSSGVHRANATAEAMADVRHAAPDPQRACALLDPEDIRAELGLRVSAGHPTPNGCVWTQGLPGDLDSYRVTVTASPTTVRTLSSEITQQPDNYQRTSPRLGLDSAYYTAPGPLGNATTGVVIVSAGYRWQVLLNRPNGLPDLPAKRHELLGLAQQAF